MRSEALFTPEEFKAMPASFRIGAIIADGMWYPKVKWRGFAKVTVEELDQWIEEKLSTGELVQQEAPNGITSYRFPYASMEKWHREQGIPMGSQLLARIYPARFFKGKSEVEHFLAAPLREIAIVTFFCSTEVAKLVMEALAGVAKVKETRPGEYRAYGLDSVYIKGLVDEVFSRHQEKDVGKIIGRGRYARRELVDIDPEYVAELIQKNMQMVKNDHLARHRETLNIFLPEQEDKDGQVLEWVISALEKYREDCAVPFIGFLGNSMVHWPHNLSNEQLSKELSDFQRKRSRALKELREAHPERQEFSAAELSQAMAIPRRDFDDLETRHRFWLSTRSATTLVWDENNEEKAATAVTATPFMGTHDTDVEKAHYISVAIINAALETGKYQDAFLLISQMGVEEHSTEKLDSLSKEFLLAFASNLKEMGI